MTDVMLSVNDLGKQERDSRDNSKIRGVLAHRRHLVWQMTQEGPHLVSWAINVTVETFTFRFARFY